jgi:lambda family phage portal protein
MQLRNWLKKSKQQVQRQQQMRSVPVANVVRARYDAAQTTAENARHWAMADAMSADCAASADIRKKLRERARYEVANNSYAKGIVLTMANDCIGTGPRLQLLTKHDALNRQIEEAFDQWSKAVSLASKLRTMRMAKSTDGEAFGVLSFNPNIDSPVALDLQLIEADRIASPSSVMLPTRNDVDGVILDSFGNPQFYSILRQHPGGLGNYSTWMSQYDEVPAGSVIHWFRADRPEQHRGIPEITPALPLFAQLRRYTLAVIAAAETAADFAAVLYTDSPANGEAQALDPMDIVSLEKRMATVLPDGWRLGQIDSQQPTTTYAEFKREILNEIARCMNLPYNIAACNSSGYNYASGRLDHQTYYKSIRVEQMHLAEIVLDQIFNAWIREAMLTPELSILRSMPTLSGRPMPLVRGWFFDGTEHVDPAKEANAQAKRLSSHTTTLAAEYARQGKDWETELRQRAKETRLMQTLGLTTSESQSAQPSSSSSNSQETNVHDDDTVANPTA